MSTKQPENFAVESAASNAASGHASPLEELDYTVEVLEETPERVTRFLQAAGAVPILRTLLGESGMTDDDVAEGRTMLLDCLAAPLGVTTDGDTADARAQRAAVAMLDQWDEPNFARYGATLLRHYPSAHAYVFRDLKASSGPSSVNGVATFLGRVAALESGDDPARSGKQQEDAAAVALLAKRGLTRAERARLKEHVDVALGPTAPLATSAGPDFEAQRLRRLNTLRRWYDEWSSHARAVVRKRAHLIRLGMAERKSPERKPAPEPQDNGVSLPLE